MMESTSTQHSLVTKVKAEAVHGLSLTTYFASWFCAISFLTITLTHDRTFSLSLFGLAFIKAGLCSKFLLIGEAVFPLNVQGSRGIILPLLRHSFLYLLIVLSLTYVETGIDGLLHGRGFIVSLMDFGDGDPLRVLAFAIVYWLILGPYLVLRGIQDAIGSREIRTILFGGAS